MQLNRVRHKIMYNNYRTDKTHEGRNINKRLLDQPGMWQVLGRLLAKWQATKFASLECSPPLLTDSPISWVRK